MQNLSLWRCLHLQAVRINERVERCHCLSTVTRWSPWKSCLNFKVFLCNFSATSLALMIVEHHKKSVDHPEMHCGCNGGFVP